MPGKRTAKKSPVPEDESPGRKKIKGNKNPWESALPAPRNQP